MTLSHQNLAAGNVAFNHMVTFTYPNPELMVAYLPLAHIFELQVEMTMLTLGWSIGYACPKTLSHRGAIRIDEATVQI